MPDQLNKEISDALLAWYDRFARKMPWRGIHDPYKTWISETMLQQTRVATVIPLYNRFMDRFPTLSSLAEADEAVVLKLWEGLGYYSRARNLLKGARQVAAQYQGILPRDPGLLEKISGIGPYTSGAVASIAYGVPVPAVDGNVHRVYSRIFGIRESLGLPEIRRKMDSVARSLVPESRPGDYNQAVMDLGATVCIPGTPDCGRCPLSGFCDAFVQDDAADLPVLPGKKPPKIQRWTVPVILSDQSVLLRRRKETLLHGLWCFPLLDCDPLSAIEIVEKKFSLPVVSAGPARKAKHVFTHLIWEMTVLPLQAVPDLPAPADYRWIQPSEIDTLAFPAAMNIPLQEARRLLGKK